MRDSTVNVSILSRVEIPGAQIQFGRVELVTNSMGTDRIAPDPIESSRIWVKLDSIGLEAMSARKYTFFNFNQ
jgi:hypothetical protein